MSQLPRDLVMVARPGSVRYFADEGSSSTSTGSSQPASASRGPPVTREIAGDVRARHFKSKFVQPRASQTKAEVEAEKQLAADYRLRQACAVIELVHARFSGNRFSTAWFAVAGDFNSLNAEAPALEISAAGLEDAVARLPVEERWTEYYAGGGSVGQLDYLFLSPALPAATAGTLPSIERRGIGMRDASTVDGLPLPKQVRLEVSDTQQPTATINFRFDRFPGVTKKAKASDHCPVFFDLA
jgi:hypothetical protein